MKIYFYFNRLLKSGLAVFRCLDFDMSRRYEFQQMPKLPWILIFCQKRINSVY